ncbi:uncharacterized protein LOC123379425 [Felis catus]|uniref:uncharacterized protein LOC123379425 n=1 Tax=Felis catus TaxID=9685 RepID=UPI001D1A25DA|nr:uncharacterized protein LOC123379425 [Felis catus]
MPNYGVLLVVGASGKQKTARKRERAVETPRQSVHGPGLGTSEQQVSNYSPCPLPTGIQGHRERFTSWCWAGIRDRNFLHAATLSRITKERCPWLHRVPSLALRARAPHPGCWNGRTGSAQVFCACLVRAGGGWTSLPWGILPSGDPRLRKQTRHPWPARNHLEMSLWNPGSLVTGPMDVAWWSRPAPGSRGALGLSLGEVGSNAAGFLQPSWVQTEREGTGGEELVSDRDAHQLPSAPALRPGLFPVTFGASPQTLGWRGVSWRCAWASTATRGSCTRNCSLRSDTGLGPSLPSDRCHPRLHGSGPTLGGSLARGPDPQDTFGKALAACTCRELRSGALGTRYRPPNRRPQARVTLVSVSPVELRTSRAGANWVLWPPGSAFTWRTWLTSTHLYCSPTGLDSRGLETQRRMELWYRLAGRVHASPAWRGTSAGCRPGAVSTEV